MTDRDAEAVRAALASVDDPTSDELTTKYVLEQRAYRTLMEVATFSDKRFNPSSPTYVRDPIKRAILATSVMEAHRAAVGEMAAIKRAAIQAAVDDGMTQVEIAGELNVDPSRISQILRESE